MLPVIVVGVVLTGLLMIVIPLLVQGRLTRGEKGSHLNQGQGRYKRDTTVLWRLILLAIAYTSLLSYLGTFTGLATVDGGIGLALGLYICSHPAANAVNMLFFERDSLRQLSEWSMVLWLGLNLLALLSGWVVIFMGLRRLVGGAGY